MIMSTSDSHQINRLLTALRWSQPRLAAYVGVSQQTISRWIVSGKISSAPAQRLLDQLESDLAAGRIVADAAEPSTAVQAQGFASAHGGA